MTKKSKTKKKSKDKRPIYRINDLYELWDNKPSFLIFEDSTIHINSPVIQGEISRLLGTGVTDDNGRTRRFLTVNEILDLINENPMRGGLKVKRSNLYYHLERLESQKIIHWVYCLDGQYKRKYFSKTSKIILLFDSEEEERKEIDGFLSPTLKLLDHYKVKPSEEKLHEIRNEIFAKRRRIREDILIWIKKYNKMILDLQLELVVFIEQLYNTYVSFPYVKELMDLLKPHLDFMSE